MENQMAVDTAPEAKVTNVKIVGHELISKKLFDTTMHILIANEVHMFDECISKIRFNDNTPEGMYGEFDYDTKEIDINLTNHLDYTMDLIKDDRLSRLSFRGHLWFGLLTTVLHEVLHATAYAIDPETVLNTDRDELEKNNKAEAARLLALLIRDYDVEPPLLDDDPFFGPRYMEFYVKKIKDNAEQWAINQKEIHQMGIIWKHDEATENSFRKWYKISYDHADDPEWDKDVAPLLTVEVENEPGAENLTAPVFVPSAEPSLNFDGNKGYELPAAPILPPAGPVEQTYVAPSPEILAALPTDMDPESLMALYNSEEPIDIPEDDYYVEDLPQGVAIQRGTGQTAPTQQSLPLETTLPPKQETTTMCRSCGVQLPSTAKFCLNCGTSTVATEKPVIQQEPVQHTAQPQPTYAQRQAPMPSNLPNYNLSAEQIRACVGEILIRCYQHIYSKCGFRPGQNPQFAPELRGAIAEPVSVLGIACVDKVLVAMDAIDAMNGRYQKQVPVVNGMIRGKTTKNMGLPSYTLYMNFNGHMVKRLILPQNQWKDNGKGGYSQPAVRAQQGVMILWMMDGDDSVPGQKWKAKVENGALEWLV